MYQVKSGENLPCSKTYQSSKNGPHQRVGLDGDGISLDPAAGQ